MRIKSLAGWPARCDASPHYTHKEALPAPFRKKINGEVHLDEQYCRGGGGTPAITIRADVPPSAMRRLVATCPQPAPTVQGSFPGAFSLDVPPKNAFAMVSRLAQSDIVQSIQIQCVYRPRVE